MTPVPLRADPFGADAPFIHRGGSFISPAPGVTDMHGIIRASARLLVMALVMAAVVIAAIVAGLGITTAVALGIVLAGVVGMVGVVRRGRAGVSASNADEIAAIMAAPAPGASPPVSLARTTAMEAMAPPGAKEADPEKFVPRWRRPSLLEARRADPSLQATPYRPPTRFRDGEAGALDVRLVRYAVVPMLDRPDEILGLRLTDLESDDEVNVISASGAFLEVECPNGDRGWVHRTTLRQRPATVPHAELPPVSKDADDALTALLSARGLI
jgi:hypothetical protein